MNDLKDIINDEEKINNKIEFYFSFYFGNKYILEWLIILLQN